MRARAAKVSFAKIEKAKSELPFNCGLGLLGGSNEMEKVLALKYIDCGGMILETIDARKSA